MILVILAGGLGTRLSEETTLRPKPMVEVGGKPILWHIMKIYFAHGVDEFIICCGYKGYVIKEYFANYFLHQSDVTFDVKNNRVIYHKKRAEPWKITLVDTGDSSMTGGRLKRIYNYVKNEDMFCFTYGDSLADVDISELIKFHKSHGKLATVTAVYPPGRYGAFNIENTEVKQFVEKPKGDGRLINGGYFVLSPKCIKEIDSDQTTWENEPMKNLVARGEMRAFFHGGFWQPMDTLREKNELNMLWQSGKAPWKVW